MNADEIRAAVDAGHTVHWSNTGYKVVKDTLGQYLIECQGNGHCIGLTWADGVTLNGDPGAFWIARWAPRYTAAQRVELRLDKLRGTNAGTLATIVRQLGPDEADDEVGPMYEVTLHVFEDEIEGNRDDSE